MTANAFAEDVQLAKNTGMNEHIAKPLDLNKLNDVLKQCCKLLRCSWPDHQKHEMKNAEESFHCGRRPRRFFGKRCKVKRWGLYRNRLQKPENGAGEAMQPPKSASAKEKHHTSYEVQCFLVENSGIEPLTLACHASALPAELIPHKIPRSEPLGWSFLLGI